MSARYTQDQFDFLQKTMNREARPRRATPQEVSDRLKLEQIRDQTRAAQKPVKMKYGNKRVIIDGIQFDSKKEADHYSKLKLLEKAGKITGLSLQVKYPFIHNEVKIASYIADFTWYDEQGKFIVCDVKGFRTAIYRLKKKMMKAYYGFDILEV